MMQVPLLPPSVGCAASIQVSTCRSRHRAAVQCSRTPQLVARSARDRAGGVPGTWFNSTFSLALPFGEYRIVAPYRNGCLSASRLAVRGDIGEVVLPRVLVVRQLLTRVVHLLYRSPTNRRPSLPPDPFWQARPYVAATEAAPTLIPAREWNPVIAHEAVPIRMVGGVHDHVAVGALRLELLGLLVSTAPEPETKNTANTTRTAAVIPSDHHRPPCR